MATGLTRCICLPTDAGLLRWDCRRFVLDSVIVADSKQGLQHLFSHQTTHGGQPHSKERMGGSRTALTCFFSCCASRKSTACCRFPPLKRRALLADLWL